MREQARVEYVVRCNAHRTALGPHTQGEPVTLTEARAYAKHCDDAPAEDCQPPHRVIKRTITEEDVTDAE